MSKVIIAGSRSFKDYNFLKESVNKLNLNITEIISGCALGADRLGEMYALINKIPVKKFPADWNKFGKAAGSIRNEEMAKYGEILIAFCINNSSGTLNMINFAKQYGLIVHEVHIKE